MDPILHVQIEQLFALSHQIAMMSCPKGKSEVLSAIFPRLLKLVSVKEFPVVSHFLLIFNNLLFEFISEERLLFRQDKRILKAQEFIEKNYDKPIKLSDVAKYVGLSKGALSRLFRKQTAKTFIEYLNEVRIEHSLDLLRKTDDLVSEVAYSCGFSNGHHFSKIFKRKRGVTPGTFRKK